MKSIYHFCMLSKLPVRLWCTLTTGKPIRTPKSAGLVPRGTTTAHGVVCSFIRFILFIYFLRVVGWNIYSIFSSYLFSYWIVSHDFFFGIHIWMRSKTDRRWFDLKLSLALGRCLSICLSHIPAMVKPCKKICMVVRISSRKLKSGVCLKMFETNNTVTQRVTPQCWI